MYLKMKLSRCGVSFYRIWQTHFGIFRCEGYLQRINIASYCTGSTWKPSINSNITPSYMCTRHLASQIHCLTVQRANIHHDLTHYIKSHNLVASDMDTEQIFHRHLKTYEDFISKEEEQLLIDEVEPILKRLRYESDHWDNAIQGYRETERKQWSERATAILNRIQDLAFSPGASKLSYIHILDLQKSGCIKPHIDSVRFCGDTITGLSLLSSCVMRFVHEHHKEKMVDALLKRRSIYIMKGIVRYDYTHEVLSEDASIFKGEMVPRERRISVVCRNEPVEDTGS